MHHYPDPNSDHDEGPGLMFSPLFWCWIFGWIIVAILGMLLA